MPRIGWASFSADSSCNHCSQCQLQQMKDDEFDKAAINMIGIHKVEGKSIKVEKPQGWLSEEYAVRPEMVKSILTHLGLTGVELVDTFSCEENKRFDKRMQDAWVCHWGPPLWIWCNPPYSQIDKVVIKLLADGARGVVVVPDWKTPWLQVLHKSVSKEIWYHAGSEFLKLNGRPARPTKWPI